MSSTKFLIDPTTAAVATSVITQVELRNGERGIFIATALATSETVSFYGENPDGTETALLDTDATALKLTATSYQKVVTGPIRLRISKTATAAACGVTVYK
jgi:hypothetical protein